MSIELLRVKIYQPDWPVCEFQKKGINKKAQWLYFTHLPRSPRGWICTKIGLGGSLTDVISCAEFCHSQLRGFNSKFAKVRHRPLTLPVAVNTVLALPCSLRFYSVNFIFIWFAFYRAMLCKRGLCCHAVSVRPFVTFVDHVKTN